MKQVRQRNKYCIISLTCGSEKSNRLVTITKQKQTHRCRETSGYQWEEGRGIIGKREEEMQTLGIK